MASRQCARPALVDPAGAGGEGVGLVPRLRAGLGAWLGVVVAVRGGQVRPVVGEAARLAVEVAVLILGFVNVELKVFGSSSALSVKLLFAHIKIIRVHNVSFLYKLVICSVGIFFGNHGVNGTVEHSRGQSMLYTFGVAKPNACSRKIL